MSPAMRSLREACGVWADAAGEATMRSTSRGKYSVRSMVTRRSSSRRNIQLVPVVTAPYTAPPFGATRGVEHLDGFDAREHPDRLDDRQRELSLELFEREGVVGHGGGL